MNRIPRIVLAVVALTAITSTFAPGSAFAATTVSRASLSSGSLVVEGSGARPGSVVTVTSPESVASRTADSKGRFKVSASAFLSSTCNVTVSDGAVSVVATLTGCIPAPSPTLAAVTLSHLSLDTVGTLAVGSVALAAPATTPVDVSLVSSHPTIAPVDRGSVQIAAGAQSASFLVQYASAVVVPTLVTITASTGVVIKVTTLTVNPPRPFGISPASGDLGPGFVGSDFTTLATLTTTLTLGPGAVGPSSFVIVAGQLPAGLVLRDLNTSQTPAKHIDISVVGVPTTAGTSTFTVRGTDSTGQTAAGTYTIRINPALSLLINPQVPWAPIVGAFANLWIDGSGGVMPYTWSRTAGQFPPGMSLVQDNPNGPLVRVTGTPTTAGTFTFTLRLTDAQGASTSNQIAVTVGT